MIIESFANRAKNILAKFENDRIIIGAIRYRCTDEFSLIIEKPRF